MYTGGIFQVAEHHLAGYSIARDYLKMTDDAWLSVCDPEYTVRKLNEGFFHSLLTGYVQKDGIELSSGLGKRAVFLGAYAMELGVVIGKDDMDILRAAFDKTKMHRTAIAQMNEALTHYKSNGEGWDFEEGHHLYNQKMDLDPGSSTSGGDVENSQMEYGQNQKRPRDSYNDADEDQKAEEERPGHRSKQHRRE